jgi:hypothetical protein
MWDILATKERRWGIPKVKNSPDTTVTYDTDSLMGLMNQVRDTLGYVLKQKPGSVQVGSIK